MYVKGCEREIVLVMKRKGKKTSRDKNDIKSSSSSSFLLSPIEKKAYIRIDIERCFIKEKMYISKNVKGIYSIRDIVMDTSKWMKFPDYIYIFI